MRSASPLLVLPMLAAACLAPAAAEAQVTKNPTSVFGGTYHVEPQHTEILFAVSHLGFTSYYGLFSGASGTLNLVPQDPARSSFSISVPTASVMAPSSKLVEELKGPGWLNAASYPTISLQSTKITPTGNGQAEITGNLTLHGVTRPITMTATFNGAGVNPIDHKYTVGFTAVGTLNRSQFGVSKYVPLVGDGVTVTISAAFEK